jgi:small subunit ribosomal protein S6
MRQYELTYLISDEVPEGDLNKITGKVGGFITELGGKVTKEEIWGRRKLAYPINKQGFATYVTLLFNLDGSKVTPLERSLKLYSKAIRHLLIIKDYGKEELGLDTEEIVENEDIKEVIGGERSFEAVLGKTGESIDLHSKRKEEKEEEEKKEVEETAEEAVAEETKEKETIAVPEEKVKEETEEEAKEEKKAVKKAAKDKKTKEEKAEKEAERLSKLDEELDQILGDDL